MDQNHVFFNTLSGAGFTINEKMTEHPDVICKFIMFPDKKYLEFVHDNSDGSKYNKPGISFGYKGVLQDLFVELKEKTSFGPEYVHRNYDWKNNDKDHLPGWNFLEFKELGFTTFNPWFTEYEKREEVNLNAPSHPNGVESIFGHRFIINEQGRAFFERIFNIKIGDKLTLSDGVSFFFEEGVENRHAAVLLHSEGDLSKLCSKGSQIVNNYLLIKNPHQNKTMWDIIIANKNTFTCPKGT